MRKHFLYICCLAVLSTGTVQLAGFKLSLFRVTVENVNIRVEWQAVDDVDVQKYQVERRTNLDTDFRPIGQPFNVLASGQTYTFVDTQVYNKVESNEVRYRIAVTLQNGQVVTSDNESVNYTSTAVRRTWGSIKAMFQ